MATAIEGVGIFRFGQGKGVPLVTQGIASGGVVELGHGANITSMDVLDADHSLPRGM